MSDRELSNVPLFKSRKKIDVTEASDTSVPDDFSYENFAWGGSSGKLLLSKKYGFKQKSISSLESSFIFGSSVNFDAVNDWKPLIGKEVYVSSDKWDYKNSSVFNFKGFHIVTFYGAVIESLPNYSDGEEFVYFFKNPLQIDGLSFMITDSEYHFLKRVAPSCLMVHGMLNLIYSSVADMQHVLQLHRFYQ